MDDARLELLQLRALFVHLLRLPFLAPLMQSPLHYSCLLELYLKMKYISTPLSNSPRENFVRSVQEAMSK